MLKKMRTNIMELLGGLIVSVAVVMSIFDVENRVDWIDTDAGIYLWLIGVTTIAVWRDR